METNLPKNTRTYISFVIITFVVLFFLQYFINNGVASADDSSCQTKSDDFNKNKYKKEFDEINNIEDRFFYWLGVINEKYVDKCKIAYNDYVKSSMDNLLQLYPEKCFFRLLRYACLYDKIEISAKHIPQLNKIFKENLTYESESYIQVEKTDALMLLVARYEFVFKNLPKDLKEYVMSLGFANYIIYDEYHLNFRACIKHNYFEEVVPFVIDVLRNNRRDVLDHHDFDIVGRMLEYLLDYYKSRYQEKFFEMIDYAEKNYTSKEFQVDHYYTLVQYFEQSFNLNKVGDDLFCKYFITKKHLNVFDIEPEYYDTLPEDFVREPKSINDVLTSKRLFCFRNLWTDIESDACKVDLLKRILIYMSESHVYKSGDDTRDYMFYYPTSDSIKTVNSIEDVEKVKNNINESFSDFFATCFIEYKTDFVVRDKWLLDRYQPVGMQRDRLIYKWMYSELGYGSPTFPSECFIAWDKHKFEFPEYEKRRKQYLEYQKKYSTK